MDYLPVFLDVRGRAALVVGGGKVALRKAELLVQAGALPRVVAPAIQPALVELAERHGGSCDAVSCDESARSGVHPIRLTLVTTLTRNPRRQV